MFVFKNMIMAQLLVLLILPIRIQSRDICETSSEWFVPDLKLGKENIYMVAGNKTRVQQIIEMNRCIQPGERCQGSSSLEYHSYCYQNYASYRVLVYDENAGQHIERIFQYPSSCTCKIEKIRNKSFK